MWIEEERLLDWNEGMEDLLYIRCGKALWSSRRITYRPKKSDLTDADG